MKKPRCFVAMAFDRDDTDVLYEKSIEPVLVRNQVIPVIINRRESNDDLNIQIIQSLNDCDFCIADLTYTRPSVYFEAGYAQRAVPVVYTVRADHLGKDQTDDKRVHFDLQMKPLLRWRDPDDPQFRERLEKRIRASVLREWQRAQQQIAEKSAEHKAFLALSVNERLTAIRRQAILALRPFGFRSWDRHGLLASLIAYANVANSPDLIFSRKRGGTQLRIATIFASETVTAKTLEDLRYALLSIVRDTRPEGSKRPQELRLQALCLALRSLPATRVEGVFSDFGRGDREGRFVRQGTIGLAVGSNPAKTVPSTIYLDCVSAIRSEKDLRVELQSLLTATFGKPL